MVFNLSLNTGGLIENKRRSCRADGPDQTAAYRLNRSCLEFPKLGRFSDGQETVGRRLSGSPIKCARNP